MRYLLPLLGLSVALASPALADPPQKGFVQQTYTEIASAKPVPRAPRFRRPVQQEAR